VTIIVPRKKDEEADVIRWQTRWHAAENIKQKKRIFKLIKGGAGENFLSNEYAQGNLPILDSPRDLKGIYLLREHLDFPEDDNFKGIRFDYAKFEFSTFNGATFLSCSADNIYTAQTTFKKCDFHFFNSSYSTFRNVKFINCDFTQFSQFTKSYFFNVVFENCSFYPHSFNNCTFNANTIFKDIKLEGRYGDGTENKERYLFYKGLKKSYLAGEVTDKARQYLIEENNNFTKYNINNFSEKLFRVLVFNCLTGYGQKPFRVLGMYLIALLILSLIFFTGLKDLCASILVTSGAMLTLGNNIEKLDKLPSFYSILYQFAAMLGIFFNASFVTVLFNRLLFDTTSDNK